MMRLSRSIALTGSRPGGIPVPPLDSVFGSHLAGSWSSAGGFHPLAGPSAEIADAVDPGGEVVARADLAVVLRAGVPGPGAVDVRREVPPPVAHPVVGLAEPGDRASLQA